MKRNVLILAVMAGLIVSLAGIFMYSHFAQPGQAKQQTQIDQRRSASPVETAQVKTGMVNETVEAVGTLVANETVTIAPEIAGRVTSLDFAEGSEVKAGQVLVHLDASILEAELRQAQADLSLADDIYERASQLAKRGAGTIVALEQATAQRLAAQVKIDLARTRIEKTRISTPFAGVAGLRTISVGNFVNVGQPIVSVTSVDPIKLDFRIPELYLTDLKDGQPVDVSFDALPGARFVGKVYAIDPVIDVNGRAIRARALIENKDRALAPGLFARVTLTVGKKPNAILIPESALVAQEGGGVVYVVADGIARRREVKIGKRVATSIEVLEGLSAGETVVTAGQMRLRDGAAVAVQTARAN